MALSDGCWRHRESNRESNRPAVALHLAGYTLVELLAALAITVVVLSVIIGLFRYEVGTVTRIYAQDDLNASVAHVDLALQNTFQNWTAQGLSLPSGSTGVGTDLQGLAIVPGQSSPSPAEVQVVNGGFNITVPTASGSSANFVHGSLTSFDGTTFQLLNDPNGPRLQVNLKATYIGPSYNLASVTFISSTSYAIGKGY